MLMCAMISWGEDLLIRPCESLQWLKDLKRRLTQNNVNNRDYIIFDSGYFTPLDFDNGLRKLSEEEVISTFGNQSHRRPKWDRDTDKKQYGDEWAVDEYVYDKQTGELVAKN